MPYRFAILVLGLSVACGAQGVRKSGDGAVATGGEPSRQSDVLLTPDSAYDGKGTGGAAGTGGTAGTGGAGSSDASVGTGGAPGRDGSPAAPDASGGDGPIAGSGGGDGPAASGGRGSGGGPGSGGWGGFGGMIGVAGATGTVVRTPEIVSFTASPPAIGAGQSSTLRWVMNGATTLSIDQGVGSVLGTTSVTVKPAQTTTYTITLNGTISARVTVTVSSTGFWATGSMKVARKRHTATLLSSGKVLIAGGLVGSTGLASAELYDPETGIFTATGSLTVTRGSHTATLLQSGKVLLVGGRGDTSAELYDPGTGTFTAAGNTIIQRYEHTATLLQNGKVLITGSGASTGGLTSAELYDPAAGTFTATGDMTVGRGWHAAILLPSGMVFLAGGYAPVTGLSPNAIASTEQYDPKTGVFAATGNMTVSRYSPTATLLLNGTVLLGGGQYGFEGYVASVSLELYDPATQKFASTGAMNEARGWHTATLLPGGLVLIAGGSRSSGSSPTYLASAELYDPATGKCTTAGSMAAAREFHTATLLANGTVLIAGGENQNVELASAELYR